MWFIHNKSQDMDIKTYTLSILGLAFWLSLGIAIPASGSTYACEIYNLQVEKGNCSSDSTYLLVVDFDVVNPGSDSFKLYANGQYFGKFAYNQLPVSIANFPKSGGNNDWVKVCDATIGDCCRVLEFPTKSCDCKIYELEVEKGDCTSDSTYTLHIQFLVENPGSDSFNLFANGKFFGTYAYSQLPLTITHFPKSGANYDWIKVFDSEKSGCFKGLEFPTKACAPQPCVIDGLKIEKGDCASDSTYLLAILFTPVNPGSDSFDFWANGKYFGRFAYAKLPLIIPNFPKSGGNNDWIKLCDAKKADCCKVLEFPTKICSAPCKISNLVAEKTDCNAEGKFFVYLHFDVQNPKSKFFKVFGNGMNHGAFAYDSLPVKIGPLAGDCVTPWEFVVKDAEDPTCFAVLELGKVCCGNDCKIQELKVEKGDCTSDSTYVLKISFQYNPAQGDSFRIVANGNYFGTYPYVLPLTITNFPKSGKADDWIKVCDQDKETCCAVKEFDSPNCGVKPCGILELDVESSCLTDSTFQATLNFVPQNVGTTGFLVKGNGVVYGQFSYAQLPLTIGPLSADCAKSYEFLVQDKTNSNCKNVKELGEVCCEDTTCHILELQLEAGICSPDATWPLSINFEVQHPGNDFFEVWVNGVYKGYYPIIQLPVQVTGLPVSGQELDTIQICINDQPDCCIEGTVNPPECLVDPNQDMPAVFLIGSRTYKHVFRNGWSLIEAADVYDTSGKVIYRSGEILMKPGDVHRIDTPMISGVYMLVMKTNTGQASVRIFVP